MWDKKIILSACGGNKKPSKLNHRAKKWLSLSNYGGKIFSILNVWFKMNKWHATADLTSRQRQSLTFWGLNNINLENVAHTTSLTCSVRCIKTMKRNSFYCILSLSSKIQRQMETIEARKWGGIFRLAISNLHMPKNYLHLTVFQL